MTVTYSPANWRTLLWLLYVISEGEHISSRRDPRQEKLLSKDQGKVQKFLSAVPWLFVDGEFCQGVAATFALKVVEGRVVPVVQLYRDTRPGKDKKGLERSKKYTARLLEILHGIPLDTNDHVAVAACTARLKALIHKQSQPLTCRRIARGASIWRIMRKKWMEVSVDQLQSYTSRWSKPQGVELPDYSQDSVGDWHIDFMQKLDKVLLEIEGIASPHRSGSGSSVKVSIMMDAVSLADPVGLFWQHLLNGAVRGAFRDHANAPIKESFNGVHAMPIGIEAGSSADPLYNMSENDFLERLMDLYHLRDQNDRFRTRRTYRILPQQLQELVLALSRIAWSWLMAEEMKGYLVRYPKLGRNIVFAWEDHDDGMGEGTEIPRDDERYVAWEHLVRQVALSRNHSEQTAENMVDDLRVKFRTLGLNDRPTEDILSAGHAEIAALEALRKGRIHAQRIIGLSIPSCYACTLAFDAVNARLKHPERYAVTCRSGRVQLTEPPDVDAGSMQRATNRLCETLMNQIEMKLAEDDDEDDDDEDEEGTASEVERTMQKMDAMLKKMSGDKRIKK